MTVRYDKEKLKRTLDFLKWGFHNGTVSIEIDEEGNLHFYIAETKVISINNKNLQNESMKANKSAQLAASS